MRQYLSGGNRGPNFSGMSGRGVEFFCLAMSIKNCSMIDIKCIVARYVICAQSVLCVHVSATSCLVGVLGRLQNEADLCPKQ